MKKHIFAFLRLLVPLTLLLCALQYALVTYAISWYDFRLTTVAIYAFHVVVTFLIYLFLLYVNKTFSDKTGFAFMACSLLKMMASVVFLWPLMEQGGSFVGDVMAFFIPYFIYLTIEVLYVVKFMQGGKG
ncbi:hypothetical protein [Sinomicrobium weinanense]|uniref:Uncharacterized protein n=1 Tax=Sinomicrobium weinanense TaxID=2842200 RepID=A0A926JTA6_9FLAO|nr:hypothetical protein [Sinomicrobium weinanense]MBC9796919.1 hypothetical protein [Sinomicrobium weinanense]MBU3124227.1 hypothetical protein [Sinomicrobium weinanense]